MTASSAAPAGTVAAPRWPWSFGRTLAVIAAVGLALRVAYVFVVGPHAHEGLDSIWYHLQAGSIANGTGYADPQSLFSPGGAVPTANFPPLWSLVLAAPYWLGVESLRSLQLVGAVVGMGTVVATGLLGRRLVSARVGLVAAVIVAVLPALLAADGSLMSDSLYVLLMLTAVLAATRAASEDDSRWWWAGSGLLLGLAALTRSDALLFAPFVLGSFVVSGDRTAVRRRVSGLLIALLCLAVPFVPWVARNRAAMGSWVVLSSNSGSLIEGANCPSTYGRDLLGGWDGDCLRESNRFEVPELERSARARRAGIDYATSHVARLPVVAAARVLRAWGLYDPIDQARTLEAIESRQPAWQVFAWATSLLLLACGAWGWFAARRRQMHLRVLTALVLGASFVSAVSNGNPRFVLVALPALAIFSAVAVDSVCDRGATRVPT